MPLSTRLPAALRARVRPLVKRLPDALRRRVRPAADQRPPFQRLLEETFARELAGVEQPIVVVVSDRTRSSVEDWVCESRPKARLHRIGAGTDARHRHVLIAALGQCDLIIDERIGAARYSDIPNLVFHLRVGGVMLIRGRGSDRRAQSPELIAREQKALKETLAAVAASWAARNYGVAPPSRGDDAQLGDAVRGLELRDGHMKLVNRRWAQAKIREEQVAELLSARPDLGRVILERPGGAVEAGDVMMSDYDHVAPTPVRWQSPSMMLRCYNDVVTTPGEIVTAGSLILPETYRHLTEKRLRHGYVADVSANFADTRTLPWFASEPPADGMRYLPGAYFYLDDEFRGHFGHMTTEVVSRLWAWDEAKAREPSLRAIMHLNKHRELASWEVQLLGAAGVPEEDIVFTRDPVRVERLISATPMFVNPAFAHPDIVSTWRRIGDNLVRQSSGSVPGDRIFVSRRIEKRPCRNLPEVEEFFSELGFRIVFPEDHPLADQVKMFREATIIAGFAGSGMFNLMFVPEPKLVLLVTSESYSGRNEPLIAGVLGHKLAVVWCRSEAAWNGRSYYRQTGQPRPIHAGFTFDFDREGAFVRDIVAGAAG